MHEGTVTTHGEAGNVGILRCGRDGEIVGHKLRQLLRDKALEVIRANLGIGLVLSGDVDDGDAALLGVELHVGVARPLCVVVGKAMQQVDHGELGWQHVRYRAVAHAQRLGAGDRR